MRTFVTILKAIITRILFATHAFVAVWKLVDLKGGQVAYWYMVAPLMFQAFEGIVSICARNGEEMKWFCPSVFLYLVSVVPPIWLMELGLNDLRVNSTQEITTNKEASVVGGLKLDLALPIERWVRVLEQVLLVMLLVGRWLLPKGKLTREQLSQLLLAYMAMAADIIELFECFKEDAVKRNIELIYATLGIWSWSLMQFTLVLSATYAPKPRPSINYPPPQEVTLESTNLLDYPVKDDKRATTCSYNIHMYLDMDIIAILTTVFMQDGPFFLLRMTLIFGYKVVSYLNIFFTCKNTLVISLQLYRLFVLCSRKRQLNRRRMELLKPQTSDPSEKSLRSERDNDDESFNTEPDKNLTPLSSPSPPLLLDDLGIDQDLEASLLEIMEQVGEETILRELENLVKQSGEQKVPTENSVTTLRDMDEGVLSQVSDNKSVLCQRPHFQHCLEEEYSPPDSGFKNCTSSVSSCQRTVKRQSVSKRNQEYIRRIEDFQNHLDGSDYASFSDTDMTNNNNNRVLSGHRGFSASSNCLADPFTDGRRRQGWNIIRERYLPNQHQQQGEWRGTSVPASLHRESFQPAVVQTTPIPVMATDYFQPSSDVTFQNFCSVPHNVVHSPQPQRRVKHGTGSLRSKVGSSRGLQRSATITGTASTSSSLRRYHSINMAHSFSNKYNCVSESDADTLETNV